MKNNIIHYAKALAEVAAIESKLADEKIIADNFIKTLVKNNLFGQAFNILKLTKRLIAKKKGNKCIAIQTARDVNRKAYQPIISKGDIVEEKINPQIIGGIIVTVNGEKQLDLSLKRKLDEMLDFQ